ncbi:peptide-methionines-oxide reductase protein [Rutstroemia sp. NJR-2017a BVV2]|nr:peptide-methionines-oxide reductase protein [Rutstroemia sp. NJR-2017a BVV2]
MATLIDNNPLAIRSYYSCTGDTSHEGSDVYLSWRSYSSTRYIPGIPLPYTDAQAEGRALYVTGVPAKWQVVPFSQIFEYYGTVQCCPTIIDLESRSTFRWVVMSTREECLLALERTHGFLLDGHRIWVTEALPPSSLVELINLNTLDQSGEKGDEGAEVRREDEETAMATTTAHRRPSPSEITAPASNEQKRKSQHIPTPLNLNVSHTRLISHRVSPSLPAQSPFPEQEPFQSTSSSSLVSPTSPTADSSKSQPQANTWATIVSNASPNQKDVDLQANTQLSRNSSRRRLTTTGRIPSISIPTEPLSEQMRVILLLDLPSTMTLTDISNAVREGPLVCIRFGADIDTGSRYSGIVFQHARDADTFHAIMQGERANGTPGRFPFIASCVRGDPFPLNDEIMLMRPPTYASRRLTIVKKAFFFAFTERNLRTLCEREVGKDHIQLVFVYNGGNATVVFSEVAAAVKMKARLDSLREMAGKPGGSSGIYEGLQVTFSKDPCEVGEPLNLQSVMYD